jgi:hypothetical protein
MSIGIYDVFRAKFRRRFIQKSLENCPAGQSHPPSQKKMHHRKVVFFLLFWQMIIAIRTLIYDLDNFDKTRQKIQSKNKTGDKKAHRV